MDDLILKTRIAITETATRLFNRNLLDLAGGNISVRLDDIVCITPRYSGLRYHWDLKPEDVMIVSLDARIIEGKGELSRESKAHLRLHTDYRDYGNAVIHAHSRHILAFASMAKPMIPVLEATRKFGEIKVVGFAPSHTADLAINVAAAIKGQESRISKHAAAVIAPYHGLFTMAKDLDLAADAVERIDTNAYCILTAQTMGISMEQQNAEMEAAVAAFEASKAQEVAR